jgi:hypothetical protein
MRKINLYKALTNGAQRKSFNSLNFETQNNTNNLHSIKKKNLKKEREIKKKNKTKTKYTTSIYFDFFLNFFFFLSFSVFYVIYFCHFETKMNIANQ